MTQTPPEAAEARAERLAEALLAIEAGTIDRPLGKAWRADGKASKLDRCIHDVSMYDVCEACIDAHIAAALSSDAGER